MYIHCPAPKLLLKNILPIQKPMACRRNQMQDLWQTHGSIFYL